MGTFHMVKALAFTNDFDLGEAFEELRIKHLETTLWKNLDDTDLLRTCAGLVDGGNPMKFDVDKLAKSLRQQTDLLERAFQSCSAAAGALGSLGILGPKELPYTWQLITLAVVIGNRPDFKFETEVEKRGLREWFWTTTYGEDFTGVTASYERARRALEEMLQGKHWTDTEMVRDVTPYVEEDWHFDYRTVRSKAFALLLARTHDQSDVKGQAHTALAQMGRNALAAIRSGGPRSEWSGLILSLTPDELLEVRNWVMVGQLSLDSNPSLERHGFPNGQSWTDREAALEARRRWLIQQEKEFVDTFGLKWRGSSVQTDTLVP
jgi:hypothetical protein